MGAEQSRSDAEEERRESGIWYRHSGHTPAIAIPSYHKCKFSTFKNDREILDDIGQHHITHMYVHDADVPNLDIVAPRLKALKIEGVLLKDISSQLQRLKTLEQLEELSISCVDLSDGIPLSILRLTALQKLELENCRLKALPLSITSMSNLKTLKLNGNSLQGSLPDAVSKLSSLKELHLAKCNLKNLPTSMHSLHCLKDLDLRGNDFSKGLPGVITKLTSLESLSLCDCKMTKLSGNLLHLENLKELDLSENPLRHGLPEAITKLKLLDTLSIEECELTDLPPSLTSLENLKVLSASGNDFSKGLPSVVAKMKSLQKIWLDKCQLSDVPTDLSSLTNLKTLILSENHFPSGLPEVISSLIWLEDIEINHCQLRYLPADFGKLSNLKKLELNSNQLHRFPQQICQLKELTELSLNHSQQLESLSPDILSLFKLEKLGLSECPSLNNPPPNVTKQGLKAIKQYYRDYEQGEGRGLPAATISVIGRSKAGKTSLIRTLKQGTRVLTEPGGTSEEDISTKVFAFEEVEVENSKLRFIDFGGQEIYHLAYGLTLRENCVPVIVVNMEMYRDMSEEIGDREAVRRLYFDWMAHLYLAQPDLPAPKLVITHKDKFVSTEFEIWKARFLSASTGVRDSILLEESRLQRKDLQHIKHLSYSIELFSEQNIFEAGIEDDQQTFGKLKHELMKCCQLYHMKVPRVWEEVEESIRTLSSGFSLFEDLLSHLAGPYNINQKQLEVVLTYMHSCGKLLWYKDEKSLRDYVFHKISAVTVLFNVLLDSNAEDKWQRREQEFNNCQIRSQYFLLERYLRSVERFKETGIISLVLLAYLIKSESSFQKDDEIELAVALLATFRLVYGPVRCENEPSFIIPHFAVGYFPSFPDSESNVQLQVDLVFNGLALPQHVYHEMTVSLLEQFPSKMDDLSVLYNGAKVEIDDSTVCLTHDSKAGRASVVVSSSPDNIGRSWNQLITVVNNTIRHLLDTWKAARLECVFYCAHCKLKGSEHPRKVVDPAWSAVSKVMEVPTDTELKMVKCGDERIVSAFRFPCKSLSQLDKERLLRDVEKFKSTRPKRRKFPPSAVTLCEEIPDSNEGTHHISFEEVFALLRQPSFQPIPTQQEVIKSMYHDTNKVYKMTSPRGSALIINNIEFNLDSRLPVRVGSGVDLRNLERLFSDMDLGVITHVNQTAKEILSTIATVTQQRELEDHGMFVLVLMSHGAEDDRIFGTDGNVIDLQDVFYMLSSYKFPAMARKPKLVIVQACSGVLGDHGPKGRKEAVIKPLLGMTVRPDLSSCSHPFGTKLDGENFDHLNTDDLIVCKPSFNSYASVRHDTKGTPFISYLVYNFCKYACHKDVKALLEMVQHDVRVESIKQANTYRENCYGQTPMFYSMLTGLRKLYLFPGYDGEK